MAEVVNAGAATIGGIPWTHRTIKSWALLAAAVVCLAAEMALWDWIKRSGGHPGAVGALTLIAVWLSRASRAAAVRTTEPGPQTDEQRRDLALIKGAGRANALLALFAGGLAGWFLFAPYTDPHRVYILFGLAAAASTVTVLRIWLGLREARLLKSLRRMAMPGTFD